jgi:hypothetical protein
MTTDLLPPWLTTVALVTLICVITATATGHVANPPRRKPRKDQP